jgi:hypothetical protein
MAATRSVTSALPRERSSTSFALLRARHNRRIVATL